MSVFKNDVVDDVDAINNSRVNNLALPVSCGRRRRPVTSVLLGTETYVPISVVANPVYTTRKLSRELTSCSILYKSTKTRQTADLLPSDDSRR